MLRSGFTALALACALVSGAQAQQTLKIGLITTLSGPEGVLGAETRDAFQLALKHRGGMLGGMKVEVVMGDDQTKPDIGRQLADKKIGRAHV